MVTRGNPETDTNQAEPVSYLVTATACSLPRVSTLLDRIDTVCRLRGLNDHAWSTGAGLSPKYLYVARNRALKNPNYRLPEDGAEQLARFAAIRAEWLRYGRGPMERDAATPGAPSARAAFVQQLARSIADLAAAGDDDAARRAARLLTELLTDETTAQAAPRAVGADYCGWWALKPTDNPRDTRGTIPGTRRRRRSATRARRAIAVRARERDAVRSVRDRARRRP